MIEIVEYDPEWPKIFERVKNNLRDILGNYAIDVFHIGSTSVPGLSAKPIIDIILVVKLQYLDAVKCKLSGDDYQYKGEYNIPFRYAFRKNDPFKINLHVHEENSSEIEINLLFKKFLLENSDAKKEYGLLKATIAKDQSMRQKVSTGISRYNLKKNGFIVKALKSMGFDKICFRLCTQYEEWQSYHKIRNKGSLKSGVVYKKINENEILENHYHFVLIKGIDVVAAANVEVVYNKAVIHFLASKINNDYDSELMNRLKKWCKFKNYRSNF